MARGNGPAGARHQLRQPRLAEMVASTLRSRILSGELADGSLLPKQDELLDEFGVSLPPIREALRILETEGLITVQRGNVGGAVVHAPQAGKVVFMMGMVLESRQVPLSDVLSAVIAFEPACAAACAGRPDRATAVLPALRATLDAAEATIDDPTAYASLARTFHIQIADLCGNEAMSLVVGALESLWTGHVDAMAREREEHGAYSDLAQRRRSAKEHEKLYAKIEKGDVRGAEQVARTHFAEPDPGWKRAVETERTVRAEFLDGR